MSMVMLLSVVGMAMYRARDPGIWKWLADDVRDEDAFGVTVIADTAGELYRGSEEVVVFFHGLAGAETDTHVQRVLRLTIVVLAESALDRYGTFHRADD